MQTRGSRRGPPGRPCRWRRGRRSCHRCPTARQFSGLTWGVGTDGRVCCKNRSYASASATLSLDKACPQSIGMSRAKHCSRTSSSEDFLELSRTTPCRGRRRGQWQRGCGPERERTAEIPSRTLMEAAVTPLFFRSEGTPANARPPLRAARATRPEEVVEIERAAPRVVAVAGMPPEKAEQPVARESPATTTRLSMAVS